MLASAVLAVQATSAQTVEDSKLLDNWYIGVNTGLSAKTTHTAIFKNLNPSAGLRVGRYLTPVFGFAVEGEVYFNNKGSYQRPLGTFVKGLNLSLLGTTNFSNWFGGYDGEPRLFEVVGVYGLGWGHVFSTHSAEVYDRNALTSKLGIDFAFNLGADKAWQLYIEPNITYAINSGDGTKFNVNNSAIGLLVGANYKFGNSNGTHNFKLAELRNQAEIDDLNNRINDITQIKKYMEYAKSQGIRVLPPCVNKSRDVFRVENGALRFGLGGIKNIGICHRWMKLDSSRLRSGIPRHTWSNTIAKIAMALQ